MRQQNLQNVEVVMHWTDHQPWTLTKTERGCNRDVGEDSRQHKVCQWKGGAGQGKGGVLQGRCEDAHRVKSKWNAWWMGGCEANRVKEGVVEEEGGNGDRRGGWRERCRGCGLRRVGGAFGLRLGHLVANLLLEQVKLYSLVRAMAGKKKHISRLHLPSKSHEQAAVNTQSCCHRAGNLLSGLVCIDNSRQHKTPIGGRSPEMRAEKIISPLLGHERSKRAACRHFTDRTRLKGELRKQISESALTLQRDRMEIS
eukprot:CAMPEP_0196658444 /NCGR_PEP_ID=MMETSP1086-20130531/29644_1 /TAXON_ID=77921 /ORGANISM="Cyanoptyche  gloeocystis , Strain SAG4.97" /LENGTH=254 /DNA_ID=CAMNT_0041992017 /DNA_START=293 /DNA_END=1054 /DNA_ORIENTATION=+